MDVLVSLVMAGAVIAMAGLGWMLLQLREQHERIRQRLDDVERRAATRLHEVAQTTATLPAPSFDLPALDGTRVSMSALLSHRKPLILTFLDPRCGPCYELLPDIGGWQRVYGDRLTIVLISSGTAKTNQAMTAEYGIEAGSVLLQQEDEVASLYDTGMLPAAVMVQPDGRLAGTVAAGAWAVRNLVAEALGLALPDAPIRVVGAVRRGERVPSLRRPDLDGNAIDVGAVSGETTLLLFWSPGCSPCRELLPAMKAWEAAPGGPRTIVVSRGPVVLNQEAGLRSPIVLDDDEAIATLFGLQGTPSAVILDGTGTVASEVARGARAVQALVGQLIAQASPAAD